MLTLITKQKKIRIELEDAEGGKYNLSLEGSMSRDKMVKACELMELLELEDKQLIIILIIIIILPLKQEQSTSSAK